MNINDLFPILAFAFAFFALYASRGRYTNRLVGMIMFLGMFAGMAIGQTNDVPVPPAVDVPRTTSEIWDAAIACVSPIIVLLVNKAVPKMPKWVLPSITPFVGIGLGLILNWLAKTNLTWVDMAKAGMLAVFVREVWNQAITKGLLGDSTTTANPS